MIRIRIPRTTRNLIMAGCSSILLGGCLMAEPDAEALEEKVSENRVSGSVGDGPIVGANMVVFAEDGSLIAEFQSDTFANYSVQIKTKGKHYPLIVEASGGTDLVTNQFPDFSMRALVGSPGKQTVANVNPFSTISVMLADELPGGITAGNVDTAQAIVAAELNSGLDALAATGPMTTHIDEHNIAEIIRASELLSELVRRTRDLLLGAGYATDGDAVLEAIASDLTDQVLNGRGGANADARTAAVTILVYAQVLMESMANELHVNGSDATLAMESAMNQVSARTPTTNISDLTATSAMVDKARLGLAAAMSIDDDPGIEALHTAVSGLQSGMDPMLVRSLLPTGYRGVLQNALLVAASGDMAVLDSINNVATADGDPGPGNQPPSIAGTPATMAAVGSAYSFIPSASDPDGDTLTFSIANLPSWANFNAATGELSGIPDIDDAGEYAGVSITVSDGEFVASLASFSVNVTLSNTAPTISGAPPADINADSSFTFTPTASDPDGDSLVFSITNRPSWATFDASTGTLAGTPGDGDVGVYSGIMITVSDGIATASIQFTITVNAISVGSVTLNWNAPTQNEDGTTLTDLAGYRIYSGTTSGSYTELVTINNPSILTYQVDNLAPGTYYFVATAFNTQGIESGYSGEAMRVVP
ncbi:MAG: putative Ig domain-containing protein [Woeseiaceae bacterium]|nr:putative Ig domain-containing protein [Woeseiaceae bacterium]